MEGLIIKIEETVSKLLQYDTEGYAKSAEELAGLLASEFTRIVSYYADPRMSDHLEDAKYWPGQLERIMGALAAGDDLATADILYNETRANLLELSGILRKKGVI